MNKITITAIDPDKCSAKSVGFITDPEVTEDVIGKVHENIGSGGGLSVSLDGATVVISGSVFPPSNTLIESTTKILSDAYNEIVTARDLKAANHKNLVDQYAKAYGLPILER